MKYGREGPSAVLSEHVSYLPGDRSNPSGLTKHTETSLEPPTRDSTTDLQLVTLPSIISGFSLSTRRWGFFSLDEIHALNWNESAYGDLHMDKKKKETIRTLVEEHRGNPLLFDDVIAGKGFSLVLLLHGPPGSGKTMTADMAVLSHPQ